MLLSCTSEKQVTLLTEGDCMVIPFESGVENVKPVKLSDIAEKVAFVPLETTDTSLVARQMLSQIRLANGCIYVPCSEGLLTFDEKTENSCVAYPARDKDRANIPVSEESKYSKVPNTYIFSVAKKS